MENKSNLLADTNDFIRLAEELFDSFISPEYITESETIEEEVYTHILFFNIKKKKIKEKKVNKKYNDIKKQIDYKIAYINSEDSVSFFILWQFCQFIRWCDKVFFFQNTETDYIVVDSDIYSTEERNFVIQNKPNYIIYFKLSINTINGKFDTKNSIKVIELKIDRLYGKKLSTKFIIVDSKVEYRDDSDLYLINSINAILKKCITNRLTEAYKQLEEFLSDHYGQIGELRNE